MHPIEEPKKEASAATKAQFAQEVAEKFVQQMQSRQHKQEWADKMEQLAAQPAAALPVKSREDKRKHKKHKKRKGSSSSDDSSSSSSSSSSDSDDSDSRRRRRRRKKDGRKDGKKDSTKVKKGSTKERRKEKSARKRDAGEGEGREGKRHRSSRH
jgi:hypothetical protein